MKPLSELTTNEVESELYNCVEEEHAGDVSRLLAELLRRERDRCASECEAMMAILVGHAGHTYDAYTALEKISRIIRALP